MAGRWLPASIAAGLCLAAFAWLFSLTPMAHRVENQYALGLLFGYRGPIAPPTGAVVIGIDRATINWLRDMGDGSAPLDGRLAACLSESGHEDLVRIRGPNTLPRSFHACLLEALGKLGFTAVAFDILFSVEGAADDDNRFAQAIRAHGRTAVLIGLERSTVQDGGAELLVEQEVQPFSLFGESAAGAGAFIVPRGGPVYGYWRTIPGFDGMPSLPEEVYRLQHSPADGRMSDGLRGSPFQYLWLYGPPGSIETISARDLLLDDVSDSVRASARSAAAFIGASDPNTADFLDTFPSFFRGNVSVDISGVELAATAYLNRKTGETLLQLPPGGEAALIAGFAFVLGFLARARSGYGAVAAPLGALAYLAVAAYAFTQARLFLPVATPVFATAPLALLLAVVVRYRFARALLMHLAPAPVARRMLTRATDRRSEAISEDATIIFFDLIGSTAIAEKIEPLTFSALLNSYHDAVTDQVEKHRGLISAFSGDGVLAVFTESAAGSEHAVRACRSAQAVVRSVQQFNASHPESPALHLRIGLNSGSVAEGEIGARDRFNFSVVGDAVNLASRLEQLGKVIFPNETDVILVGGSTYDLSREDDLEFIDCGFREIPGRERSERVFRLIVDRATD